MDKFAAMRVFVKISEAGSLSAAGRQLGLSLNSVSRQLIALEQMLGTTLVERTTRHLSLTEAGRPSFAAFEVDDNKAARHVRSARGAKLSTTRSTPAAQAGSLIG
jgi:molybdate transport repressor ModE-like protein